MRVAGPGAADFGKTIPRASGFGKKLSAFCPAALPAGEPLWANSGTWQYWPAYGQLTPTFAIPWSEREA